MSLQLGMVTIDCADTAPLAEFWSAALDMRVALDLGEFVLLVPNTEGLPSLGLQRVAEPKAGKNRVHMDCRADDRAAEVARLVGLGATAHGEHDVPGLSWTVMTDPAGNEFCVGAHG